MNNDTDTPRPTRTEQLVALSLYAIVAVMVIQLGIRPLLTWLL
ncbi:MAG TPA: hypothetical protein PLS95_18630 [Thermoanaerobaculales bacterium]|nr:hypothetical protein [Thermoanaerobaculales bacterium]